MKKNSRPNNNVTLIDSCILPQIGLLDFERIKHKLMVSESQEQWTFEQCEEAEREYKRFLTLIKLNPGVKIVPTKQMDKFWHQHILDTVAYEKDCNQVFGFFLHHFPYFGIYGKEDKANLVSTFENTRRIYQETFGEEVERPKASRCEGHACHAESECACRVAGACKNA